MTTLMKKRLAMATLCVMSLFGLSACGGGGGDEVLPPVSSNSSSSSSSSVPAPSSLSYTNPVTATIGQSMAVLSPTVSGSVTTFSVSPSLPAGISLNTSNGQISGTPIAVTAQAGYVVTASNVSGSTSFTLLLAVVPMSPPSGLMYSSPVVLTVGQTISAVLNPVVTGVVDAYSVAPALPAGLSFNTTTGQISGTPTAAAAQATYTITASNVGGSTTFGLILTVQPSGAPSMLSYPNPVTLVATQPMTALNPTVIGTVLTYSVSPALPSGLSLNTATGQISGTPISVTALANYIITAGNALGSTSFVLSLKVDAVPLAPPTGLSYPSPRTYTVGVAIAALSPTVTGTVTAYSVAPALPTGLSLNASSGQISGTPTVVSAATNYTITASNSSGGTTFALNITVNVAPPSALSYPSPHTFVAGTPISAISPTVTGTVTSYSVSPALPAGLLLNASTGVIAGTPTTATVQAGYTITASNGSGSTTFVLTVTVNALPPSGLSYPNPQSYTVGTAITTLTPTVTGTVTSYSVAPALPGGLTLNASNGQISGTPTTATAQANYTVTASNSGGLTTFALSITVNPITTAPTAPTVSVGYGIKQVVLNWLSVPGATSYRVYKNPDGSSGYAQISGSLTATTYADVVAVHLTDWLNARYIVSACNSFGCTDSAAVFAMNSAQAIGYFKASDTEQQDVFGWDVEISRDGNTLAVGAAGKDSNATGANGTQGGNVDAAGAVYVFVRNGMSWTQQAFLKASNATLGENDGFGTSIALSDDGNTLAVGAPSESSSATGINGDQSNNSTSSSGAVYVFTRAATTWSQQAYVKASNTDAIDHFGDAVALSADGNTLAVGAYVEASNATGINGDQADNSLSAAGAVYLFTRTVTTWAQQAYVKASNTKAYGLFGSKVALSSDGNTLAVSGDQAGDGIHGSGAVYVFVRAGTVWSQQAYINVVTDNFWDVLGSSLDLSSDGNTLAAGSKNSSKAYVFVRSGGIWSQQSLLISSNAWRDTTGGDEFGSDISISADGNILAISAPYERSNATGINGDQTNKNTREAGAVFVFTRMDVSWSQKTYVKASNTQSSNSNLYGGDAFGIRLDLSGDGETLAVGGYGEDSSAVGVGGSQSNNFATDSGAVYLY